MLVSDVFQEAKEVLNNNAPAFVFRAMTRAVELLAPTGLFDPFVAYLDFSVQDSYFVALPGDVAGIIKVNINQNPAFSRHKLFEFAQNTDGTVEGAEVGWSWSDRGIIPVQNETPLPGLLKAVCASVSDEGKTLTVTGQDIDGRTRKEVLTMHASDPAPGEVSFHRIDSVVKEETSDEVFLYCGEEEFPVARYYGDETVPRYRVIKLSQTNCACRMIYRRRAYKIRALDDIIPLDSPMGFVMMLDAVNLYWKKAYEAAAIAEAKAIEFVQREQASREDHTKSGDEEGQTASNRNISTLDELITADVYDEASKIAGAVGRGKVFDFITDAVEALSRKGHWDALVGSVDVWKSAHPDAPRGHGFFVLPRFIEVPLSINFNGSPGMARNDWFEFHLNGPGETNTSHCGTWDDIGKSPIINFLPKDKVTGRIIPQTIFAICEDPQDADAELRVNAYDSEGVLHQNYLVPVKGAITATPDAPKFIRIERVVKASTRGFVKFVTVKDGAADLTLGYYYPDETAPMYRVIKVATTGEVRLRIKYRKRQIKVSSMFEPLHLRSRRAIISMMRALKLEETDIETAQLHEMNALKYLRDEQSTGKTPTGFSLQIDPNMMPGLNHSID